MGDICSDYACAGCGQFIEGFMCNTDEEANQFEKEREDSIYFCDHCGTFTHFGSGWEVKVVIREHNNVLYSDRYHKDIRENASYSVSLDPYKMKKYLPLGKLFDERDKDLF